MADVLAEGYNVFDTSKSPSGTVKYLSSPSDVIQLIQSGKLKEHILLVRGGTTTFLAPALSMGAIGVITMSGAPESHPRHPLARVPDPLRHDGPPDEQRLALRRRLHRRGSL
ncbi:hypothetical protein [Actinomycetospora cinnamomea]|uniref:Uncharacterized protein n=1 Tax=Actinomycetospora cinnamomea TaxID=663609 RepID=A0A2U1FF99_9PSEU|nr:hypothetical protein [Actinomycetospora cinnamomea]PVZ10863.1 hypothetical protein C8D89_10474 [Actinomycetospora cinnamomea]